MLRIFNITDGMRVYMFNFARASFECLRQPKVFNLYCHRGYLLRPVSKSPKLPYHKRPSTDSQFGPKTTFTYAMLFISPATNICRIFLFTFFTPLFFFARIIPMFSRRGVTRPNHCITISSLFGHVYARLCMNAATECLFNTHASVAALIQP